MGVGSLLGKTVKLVQRTVQKARTRTITPSADEARIQREVEYGRRLGRKGEQAKKLQNRIEARNRRIS